MQISRFPLNSFNLTQKNNAIYTQKSLNSTSFGASALIHADDIKDEEYKKIIREKFLPLFDGKMFVDIYSFNLQNGAGYQVIAEEREYHQNIYSDNPRRNTMVKQIILDNDGNIVKDKNHIVGNSVHSWVYGGNKSAFIKAKEIKDDFWTCKDISLQMEIINGENGEPEHIVVTKPSKKLRGACDITKYVLSDYPEDLDLVRHIKKGTLDAKIEELGLKQGEKLAQVQEFSDGSKVYFEHYTYNGKEISKKYVRKSPDKNSYSYEIKNEDGSILFKMERSFKRNEDGSTTTIINGKEYITTFDKDTLSATVLTPEGKEETISIADKCILDDKKKFYKFLTSAPADFILSLKDVNKITISKDSLYYLTENTLYGPTNLSSLSHEIGHKKDWNGAPWYQRGHIAINKDVIETYNKEYDKFKNENPMVIRDILYYFSPMGGGRNATATGLSELIADVHTLMFTYGHSDKDLRLRINYLTKYFPETVAKVGTMFGYNQVEQ